MFKKLNKKGFTLAELLVVVAIIGVLVAISIPIFTSQLEKSRESVDLANIRAAYAEVVANGLTEPNSNYTITVTEKQVRSEWQTDNSITVAGVAISSISAGSGVTVDVKYNKDTGSGAYVTIGSVSVPATNVSTS